MNKFLITVFAALLIAGLSPRHQASAADYLLGPDEEVVEVSDELFTPEELDELLAPIALYPDPLIAQVLPAATYIDQIDEAARYLRAYGRYARIEDQRWDVSVKAVAHYPDVLYMMDQKYDWTVALGQAYINQPDGVMESIQYLREEARERGNLVSTPQQTVIIEDGLILIIPAQPQVIYVPTYDPAIVYIERPPSYGFVTFGVGFSIGLWLNRDCDWHGHRIYYHGWQGGGWIGRARPHLPARSSIYINRRYATVDVNRRVVQRDTGHFRRDIRRNVEQRRERIGQPPPRQPMPGRRAMPRGGQIRPAPVMTPPARGSQPPASTRESQPPVVTPPAKGSQPPARTRPDSGSSRPTPVVVPPGGPQTAAPPAPAPAKPSSERTGGRDVYRGRDTKENRSAPASGLGGYGSGREVKTYRERGLESRGTMKTNTAPAPERRTPPAQTTPPAPERQTPPARPTAPVVKPAEQQPAAEGRKSSGTGRGQPSPRLERPDEGDKGRGRQQR